MPTQEIENSNDNTSTTSDRSGYPPANSAPQQSIQPPVNEPMVSEFKNVNTPGTIVLQWLTYAFWGWSLLAICALVFVVIFSQLTDIDLSGSIAWVLPPVLVLMPISFICDYFYGRREPVKKTGIAIVIMVIHAVIFALFGIGAIVGAVFNGTQLALSSDSKPDEASAWIISFVISAALYAVTFLRTLNPLPKLKITKIYPITMIIIMGVLLVAAFIGPVADSNRTKQDREITSSLSDVSRAINEYTSEKKKLPENLNDVELKGIAKSIADRELVEYKPEGIQAVKVEQNYGDVTASPFQNYFRYQLCVTYKEKDRNDVYSSLQFSQNNEYSEYLSTYGHPAGSVCYKMQVPVNSFGI